MVPPRSALDLMDLAHALDEGRGTAYERYAVDRFLEDLLARLSPVRVLELPANGVMGVPGMKSLVLAARGAEVVLALPDEQVAAEVRSLWAAVGLNAELVVTPYERSAFAARSFDLVWSFCALEHVPNPDRLLREMVRVSRRYVLVVTQNPYNVGLPLHRGLHRWRGEPWDHGAIEDVGPQRVARLLRAAGAEVITAGGVDLPPWFDINMQLRPPAEAQPEHYADSYAHLRPGVRRRPTEQIVTRMRSRTAARGFWPWLYRSWNRIEGLLPAPLLALTAHHPFLLARVPGDPTAGP